MFFLTGRLYHARMNEFETKIYNQTKADFSVKDKDSLKGELPSLLHDDHHLQSCDC